MKKRTKIAVAALVFAFSFGGGLATANAFAAETVPVLDELQLQSGMYIRTAAPDGLRFVTKVMMSDAAYAASGITEIGTVLMPAANVTGELTIDEKDGTVEAMCIVTEKWVTETDENSKMYYSTVVAKDEESAFPAEFYNVPISARAYAKYSDGTLKYSANTETKSIGYVASVAALIGNANAQAAEVINRIANGTTKTVTVNDGQALSMGETYVADFMVGGVRTTATDVLSVDWSVKENADVVSVSQSGEITALQAGTAVVEAKAFVGDNYFTASVEVTVEASAVEPTTENVALFAIKQTNESGALVTNNYTYSGLTGNNVQSVAFGENEVDTNLYTYENGTLTLQGAAFASYAGTNKTLSVKTEADDLTVNFAKVATFAVTKATDINTGSYSVISPMVQATMISDASGDNGITWGGYIVLANDVDFGMAYITTTTKILGTQYSGLDYGFKGTFDGQGFALKNFDLWGNGTTPGSLFGRIAFEGVVMNTQFLNFRIRGAYSLGLFDECWGTLKGLTVDGTIETNMNTSSLMGKFYENNANSGAVLQDSTIIARVGSSTHAYSSTETDNKVFCAGSTFRSVENTTVQTAFGVVETFVSAGGMVETLAPSDYYAVKVNGDDANTVKSNDFVKEMQGTQVVSAEIYGRNADGATLSATISGGNVTISASALAGYVGRGQTIKVVTDAETKYFYQDVVTYAIQSAGDLCADDNQNSDYAEFIQACGVTEGSDYNGTWSGLIILANDVDCSSFTEWSTTAPGRVRTGAPEEYNTGGSFGGIFDGRGFNVSNMEIYARGDRYNSVFGTLASSAIVKNVSFVGITICGSGYTAGFFARTSVGTIDNVCIDVTPNETTATNGGSYCAIGRFNDSVRVTNSTFIVRTNAACTTGTAGNKWKIIDYSSADPCLGTNWKNTVIYSDYCLPETTNLNSIIKPLSELPTA